MRDGKLVFKLHGEKLAGIWELVRISKPEEPDFTKICRKAGGARLSSN